MRRELGMLVALVLMCAGLWMSNEHFLGQGNVRDMSRQGSRLAAFEIRIAIVSVIGGIDRAHGALTCVSSGLFLGQGNVRDMSRQVSMLAISAIGIAFVIVTGGIDLSVGSIIGLTGVLIAKLSGREADCFGYSLWVGIPVALAVAMLI